MEELEAKASRIHAGTTRATQILRPGAEAGRRFPSTGPGRPRSSAPAPPPASWQTSSSPGLEKAYPDKNGPGIKVVHGIDLEIKDREFMVLVGPSGCGKSPTASTPPPSRC